MKNSLLYLLALCLSLCLGSAARADEITLPPPQSTIDALKAFYGSTGGGGWTNSTNWPVVDEEDPYSVCNWHGVYCEGTRSDAGDGNTILQLNVYRLFLINNNLTGPFPGMLSALPNLRHLDLEGNKLSGNLPDAIGDFTSLKVLKLGNNQLTGALPMAYFDMLQRNLDTSFSLSNFSLSNNPGLKSPLGDWYVSGFPKLAALHREYEDEHGALHTVLLNGPFGSDSCFLPEEKIAKLFEGHNWKPDSCNTEDVSCPEGNTGPNCLVGNPMNLRNGVKQQTEVDYQGSGPLPLKITRSYNSKTKRWQFNSFDAFLYDYGDNRHKGVTLGNGRSYFFSKATTNTWQAVKSGKDSTAYEGYRLEQLADGIRFVKPSGDSLDFDSDGKLARINSADGHSLQVSKAENVLTIRDSFGQSLAITFDAENPERPVSITTPLGQLLYAFDEFGNLTTVTYPDGKTRQYHYDEIEFTAIKGQGLLTGITDENGSRYATWYYDNLERAYKSVHGDNLDVTEIEYLPNDANGRKVRIEHLPSGGSKKYYFDATYGVRAEQIEHYDATGNFVGTERFTYNGFGHITTHTDIKGTVTQYNRYTDGREDSRTIAAGTGRARTISTTYVGQSSKPATITTPELVTEMTYNERNQVLTRKLTDRQSNQVRTTTYTYNTQGLLAKVDGPRDDVADITTFTYDEQGRRTKTTNALGQVTEVLSFNASGKPLQIKDPNGIITTITYDSRNRPTTVTVNGLATAIEYNGTGQQTKVTLATGQVTHYEYDSAQRLTAIVDHLGNRIDYTLDGAGNRIRTDIKDPQGVLQYTQQQVFDAFSRVKSIQSGVGNEQAFEYNAANELVNQTDALNYQTNNVYDATGNLTLSQDAEGHTTMYGYDSAGRKSQVMDAEGKITGYQYNGFGELTNQMSPDTGMTTYLYDKAGNMVQKMELGIMRITNYQYDALNRLIHNSAHNATYTYDLGAFAIGKLTQVTDSSGSERLFYDHNGNITMVSTDIAGVEVDTEYHYDDKNRLHGITYPGGRRIDFTLNNLDQITIIHSGEQVLAKDITYLPFGPLKGLTFGNGLILNKTFDLDYRLVSQTTTGIEDKTLGYSARNNITTIDDLLGSSQSYGYSPMQRLVTANDLTFTYDKIGNRLGKNGDSYTYADNSHHLLSAGTTTYQFDVVGQATQKGDMTFAYNTAGLMANVIKGRTAVDYRYNHRNQRVMKVSSTGPTRYVYDLSGKLIAELDDDGKTKVEYVYLQDMLIAVVQNNRSSKPGNKIKLDDSQAEPTGDWKVKTADKAFKGTHQIAKGDTGATMTWRQTLEPGTYKVHARWKAGKKKSTAATYTVNGEAVTIDQTQNGRKWRLLSKIKLTERQEVTVVLADTGGKVSADGIRFKQVKGKPTGNAETVESQIYFTHSDHINTPTKLTNIAGVVVWQASYTPFGLGQVNEDADGDGNSVTFNIRFPGQYFDQETGLHYNWHRYYDPQVGRYLQPDIIGLGDGPSLYGYVLQNPINGIDPNGKNTLALYGSRAIFFPVPGARIVGGVLIVAGGVMMLGQLIDDDEPESNQKSRKDECIERCSDSTLPTRDNGFSFWNCVNRCLEESNECE